MLLFLYQIALVPLALVYLALRLLRGRGAAGLGTRLGFYSAELKAGLAKMDRPVWIHMVSVGEVMGGERLIQEIRSLIPDLPWVITTTTATGQSVAAKLVRPQDKLLYLPWDLRFSVRRALDAIKPRLFICFETELWPVLYDELKRREVPIAVVNGRISPDAYKRYLLIRPLMERFLRPVRLFLVQSPQDAQRYAGIGAAKDRIAVTGNIKWDIAAESEDRAIDGAGDLKSLLGVGGSELLWTAGSTHSGEEKVVFETYKKLKESKPELRLLLAPRHPERIAEVEKEAAGLGLTTLRKSKLTNGATKDAVILLDTVGELRKFYRASDVVFVGGSLIPKGGHNLMEPAVYSKPILTGPHLHNFAQVAEILTAAGGLAVVKSAEELEQRVRSLLESPKQRQDLGMRAFAVIADNRGATAKTAQALLRLLPKVS